MKPRTCKRTWLVALSITACMAARAGALARITASLPEVPPPPQGQAQWVAKSMRMNGLPMTLQVFQSRLSPDELLNYYESQAYRGGHGEFRRSTNGDWQLLGIKSPQHYVTVQVRAAMNGSEGTIAVSPPIGPASQSATAKIARKITSDFPRPRTARILNLQEYEDAGIESEHLSLSSPRSATTEARAFVGELIRNGWQVIRQQPMRATAHGVVIEAQRGAQQALLTLQPGRAQSSTTIVVVWRKS